MLISEVISKVKAYCSGVDSFSGKPIDDATTRDQVTYGDVNQECTGIVTCIWATADVIRKAKELGANLIIPHEALFWNHGDRQDVIAGNATYLAKKQLLDEWGGAVWRCHDYIHSRVPVDTNGQLADGIFYGLAWKLGWLDYRVGDRGFGLDYEIPETSVKELAEYLVAKLGLNGTRYTGDPDAKVQRVRIPMHVFGTPADTDISNATDADGVDCLVTMEMVDFTTCEYIRDAGMLGQGKCAIALGHFNLEEPGMEYMVTWLPEALGTSEVSATFVPKGDTYRYVVAR
ncbi:Nif3-like dinuclear metal center hexameric protein [uncultured Parolsenella sp.]|uniref:Nif3-like dinuclear metal center hexameric protein n=1 Tax=uncultured Parolsenella sp. TaxID=2083008 RepID=UPI0027D97028|nr:Nif3-like dinuclear metal center hexameric protein [uncultured Parolsenella sp.]